MRVPKMVKNGFNSVLPVSPVFEEDKTPKKSRIDAKPKAVPRSRSANKNHFRPISEHACALPVEESVIRWSASSKRTPLSDCQ